MRSSHQQSSGGPDTSGPGQPQYADRVYRSTAGFISGAVLLVLGLWLGGDAVFRGSGHTPWIALASLLLGVPLVVAFTLRPAVYAGDERIRIRNPFRTITLPWSAVDRVRSGFSTELLSGDHKYQLWSIPVSMRARKRAARQTNRAKAAGDNPFGASQSLWRSSRPATGGGADGEPTRAWSDQAVVELNELSERRPVVEGEPRPVPAVRWSYEIIAPAVAGAVVLIVLLAIGG